MNLTWEKSTYQFYTSMEILEGNNDSFLSFKPTMEKFVHKADNIYVNDKSQRNIEFIALPYVTGATKKI